MSDTNSNPNREPFSETQPKRDAPPERREQTQNAVDEAEWATDDTYHEADDVETTTLVMPHSGTKAKVEQIKAMKLVTLMDTHGIDELTEQNERGDVPDVSMDDIDLEPVMKSVRFYREVIVPHIVRPRNAHWADPPDDPSAPEVWDVSNANQEDVLALIAGITGQDPDELIEQAEERAEAIDDGEEGEQYTGRFQQQSHGN